jgi:hypothetical protein
VTDKDPLRLKPLSRPQAIILILMVIVSGLYGATHPNNPLSALIKMLLVP